MSVCCECVLSLCVVLTGTAAISVGCRTLVSPLLPLLIFVDFLGGVKQRFSGSRSLAADCKGGGRDPYLVSQRLRGGVADPAAVGDADELGAQLQDVGQRQVADVGVFLAATETTLKMLKSASESKTSLSARL